MSKELTPLEALENITCDLEYITRLDYTDHIVRGEVRDELYKIYHRELPELKIIEKALKRLDMYDNVAGVERIQDTNKKLKALEIVKEKEWFDDFIKEHLTREWFTKEELDLLKEVLL